MAWTSPSTTEMPPPRAGEHVQSLERGLSVIRAFADEQQALSLSDIARRTGLTRAAARRFLLTLVRLGYVHFDGRLFSLRPRVLDLGYAYLSSLGFPQVAQPHLESLSAEIDESTSVSVLDELDIVYVARAQTRRIMRISIAVGTRFPAHVTSMGRVLLAALPAAELDALLDRIAPEHFTERTVVGTDELRSLLAGVRRQGYAMVDRELEDGLRSIALPIHDGAGDAVAAINVSVPAASVPPERLRSTVLPKLRATAAAIEADLRATGAAN